MSSKAVLGGSESFYRFIRKVLFTAYRVFFGFEFYGSENVPAQNYPHGVILAPNHASYLDPPILGISLKRRVTYLAKDYLFRNWFVGWVLRNIGAFPIKSDSGNDFKSIRDLIRILKLGACVTVFPEGTRTETGHLKEPETGIAFLALKSHAAVVPVYIDGSFEAFPKGAKFFKCKKVKVFYGNAFVPAENPDWQKADESVYKAISERIMKDISQIRDRVNEKQKKVSV